MIYGARVARLYQKVFQTPMGSPEREQAISSLNETDRAAVFNLEMEYIKGRITRKEISEMAKKGDANMTYEQFREKMDNDYKERLRELTQFAKTNRGIYDQYREMYRLEKDKERMLRNKEMTEGTFRNKSFGFK